MKSIIILIKNAMTVVISKKENMELYKLNLPNGIINNIIVYNCDDDGFDYCSI